MQAFWSVVILLLSTSCDGEWTRGQADQSKAHKEQWEKVFDLADIRISVTPGGVFAIPSPEYRNTFIKFGGTDVPKRYSLPVAEAEISAVALSDDAHTVAVEFTAEMPVPSGSMRRVSNICIVNLYSGAARFMPGAGDDLKLGSLSPDGRTVGYFARELNSVQAVRLWSEVWLTKERVALSHPFNWPGSASFLDGRRIMFSAFEPAMLNRVMGRELWQGSAEKLDESQLYRTHTFIQSQGPLNRLSSMPEIELTPTVRKPLFRGATRDGRGLYLDYDASKAATEPSVRMSLEGHFIVSMPADGRYGDPAIFPKGTTVVALYLLSEMRGNNVRTIPEAAINIYEWLNGASNMHALPTVSPNGTTGLKCWG